MKLGTKFIIFSIFSVGLFSCSKEINYEVKVINYTDYHINNLNIDCAANAPNMDIKPNSTSDSFIITYDKNVGHTLLSEALICTTVLTYSDTDSTYENTYGNAHSMSNLEKGQTNLIEIKLDSSPYYSSSIFKITVN